MTTHRCAVCSDRLRSEVLTVADREAFRAGVRRLAPLTEQELAQVERTARARVLVRGETFLAAGDHAVDCGTVLTGVMREYFILEDGREVTRGFAGPGDGVGSMSDLLSRAPARSTASAETDARLLIFPWAVLREAASRTPAWASVVARIIEQLYLTKAAREYELLALDAEARYLGFRERYAALEPAISLRHVASYIGVTPEHLSRLRRRLSDAG